MKHHRMIRENTVTPSRVANQALVWIFGFAAFIFACSTSVTAASPAWAYGTPSPATTPPPPDNILRHVPGSNLEFTRAQISDGYGPADWFPGEHPAMPDVVAHGKKPAARACALCHYPNGKGRSENAGIAGLPVSYFMQQLKDFQNGDRKSADPLKGNTLFMIDYAKAMTEEDMKKTAEYYGSMKWTSWIKVVETNLVPKTHVINGMYLVSEGEEKEPLGNRIVEVPENTESTEILRDPHSGFIAYVPVNSIKKGEALVNNQKAAPCGVCHGSDLKGLGPVPGIAGRSPSYLVRQLYDIQQGARKGAWTGLMKAVVRNMSEEDMLNIAAYVSSRTP
jgi:cytochrome c553